MKSRKSINLAENWASISIPWCEFALLVLIFAVPVGITYADVVILSNGDHLEGRIVEESKDTISLLRSFKSSNITYVEKIKRSHIVSIELKPWQPTTQPVVRTESKPVDDEPELPSIPTQEQLATLTEVIKKFQDNNLAAIDASITKLINNASPGQLYRLSEKVKQRLGISLADLAAEIHLGQAIKESKGQPIRLRYVTSHEKSSLIARLMDVYHKALRQEIRVSEKGQRIKLKTLTALSKPASRPVATQPAKSHPAESGRRNFVITDWLSKPTDFDGNKAECKVFAKHIRYTLSLLNERIRIDFAVRRDGELRGKLLGEKSRLVALKKAVEGRQGGALTPAERQAILADRRRELERYRQEMELQRKKNEEAVQNIIKQMEDKEKREEALEKLRKELQRQKLEEEAYFQKILTPEPADDGQGPAGEEGGVDNKDGN